MTHIRIAHAIHTPPPAQPAVILPEFIAKIRHFPKHLIITLLTVKKVPISPDIGTSWCKRHTKADVLTVKNGVNLKTFREASPIEGFCKDGVFAIVMVAAFRPQKDQETLIRAMALLPEKCELFLAGDGETRPGLEELSKTIGVGKRVHFLGIRKDVPQILKSADVVVMSSHYEGLSLSSIEGMAVDKPFVASDVDGLHEIVEGAGILVPHRDEKALADTITTLLEDPSYCRKIALSCGERASEYDFSKMAEAYHEVYQVITGGKK